MDPVTQGALGAAAAQVVAGPRLKNAWLVGIVGGVLADADVFIRSADDPLLAIEYHRQFTHALMFIPVGGFIAALPWMLRRRHRKSWRLYLGVATVAYATHGLLDACTTYGTQLLWPFSSYRVALSWISIIDPIFTTALLVGVVWSARKAERLPAVIAIGFCSAYLLFGAIQHQRALAAQEQLASMREHRYDRGDAFPTIGNNLVWRSLYQSGDSLLADRVRVPWLGRPQHTAGSSVQLQDRIPLVARSNSRLRRDYERFRWFSDGWVARDPQDSTVIGDVRYSLRTDAFEPIWGIRFRPQQPVPTEWVDRTGDRSLSLSALWREISGTDTSYTSFPASD